MFRKKEQNILVVKGQLQESFTLTESVMSD